MVTINRFLSQFLLFSFQSSVSPPILFLIVSKRIVNQAVNAKMLCREEDEKRTEKKWKSEPKQRHDSPMNLNFQGAKF
jgi:hypothetical protein